LAENLEEDYLPVDHKRQYLYNQTEEEYIQLFGEARNMNTEDFDVDLSEGGEQGNKEVSSLDGEIDKEFGSSGKSKKEKQRGEWLLLLVC
jgi:hypothetical protein